MKIKTTIEVEFECDLTEESLKRKIKIWLTNKRNYPIKVDIKSIVTEPVEPRKTRLEYFNEFPMFYKERAIANTSIGSFHKTTEDAREAVRGAFIFSESPEGDTFWQHFSDTLSPDYIPESKSHKRWLELLPIPYREEALSKEINGGDCNSLKAAIVCAFNWDDTAEGHNYWSNLFESL